MLGINAKVEDTRKKIIEVINTAGLPSCLIDYIMTEILNDVRMSRMNAVQKEREAYQKEQEEQAQEQASDSQIPKTGSAHFPASANPVPDENPYTQPAESALSAKSAKGGE